MQFRKDRKRKWMVQVADRNGKIKTASFFSKQEAERFERTQKDRRTLQRHGIQTPRSKRLFFDAAQDYLKRRFKEGTYSTVVQENSKFKNNWVPLLGKMPVDQVTTAEILEELDRIQFEEGMSPATRNRHRALLHTFFQDLFMRDQVTVNPVAKIPLVEEKTTRKTRKMPLTEREQETYVRLLYDEGMEYGMIGQLLRWTGARICTCNVVRNEDIYLEQGVIQLRRLEERASRTVVERQKGSGEDGETIVPLFPVLRQAISDHWKRSRFTKGKDYLAANISGSYVPYDTFKDVHNRVVAKMMADPDQPCDKFTPHDLRRAFATNAKRAGYTRAEIREMLDHSSELVTGRYDLKDVEHLVEKGKRIGFGQVVDGPKVVKIGGKKA